MCGLRRIAKLFYLLPHIGLLLIWELKGILLGAIEIRSHHSGVDMNNHLLKTIQDHELKIKYFALPLTMLVT